MVDSAPGRAPSSAQQDAEKVRQLCSCAAQDLTARQTMRLGPSPTSAVPVERRVLAHRGWVDKKDGLFEHPAGIPYAVRNIPRCHISGVST